MSRIHIHFKTRFKPYSHTPGVKALVPGTGLLAELFPACVRLYDWTKKTASLVHEWPLELGGCVRDFTVVQDLEKGRLSVSGDSPKGLFRYHLIPNEGLCVFHCQRGPDSWINFPNYTVDRGVHPFLPPQKCRLSLNIHKAQDWPHVVERGNLNEILPFWHCLGQMTPAPARLKEEGTLALLAHCTSLEKQPKTCRLKPFETLFKVAFNDLLVPSLSDEHLMGVSIPPVEDPSLSPLSLLALGSQFIQALFIREEPEGLFVLPALPKECLHGRLIHFKASFGEIDLMWRGGKPFVLIVRASQDANVNLVLPKDIRRYRLRAEWQGTGIRQEKASTLQFNEGKRYYLDRFER